MAIAPPTRPHKRQFGDSADCAADIPRKFPDRTWVPYLRIENQPMNIRAVERRHAFEVFPKRDLAIVRGEGATLYDATGRAWIDCAAGVGVASVGHAHPVVAAAISEQARTLITCPGVFYNDVRARLLEKLASITPPSVSRAFLCNSGAEANEAALKFAMHATGRRRFVCAMRGFHGRTMGALSATYKYRNAFEPLLDGFDFVPFNNADRLRAAVGGDTAAVMVEIVQGEGGVRLGDAAFLAAAREVCDTHGALLIVDEVQTGFCRTGRFFACEHHDVRPDLLCLAKAMAGGVPMGAVLAGDRVPAEVGMHGSTFGGNPLACAASLATIEVMERGGLAEQARAKGARFAAAFAARTLPRVRDVRQIGLMIGIELRERARPHLEALMARGVLALPAGPTVIRLLPPLVIEDAALDEVAVRLHEVLGK